MIKKFVFYLVALLFAIHMTPITALSVQYCLADIEQKIEEQNRILCNKGASIAAIVTALNNIEKRLEEQNKILQAILETKKSASTAGILPELFDPEYK